MRNFIHFIGLLCAVLTATENLSAQNIGIGTSTPLQKLHVEGNTYIKDSLSIGVNPSIARVDISGSVFFRAGNTNIPPPPIAAIEFFTGRNATGIKPDGLGQSDIAFTWGGIGGGFRHFLITRHNAAPFIAQNAIDFYLNTSVVAGGSSGPEIGNVLGMSITDVGVGVGTNAPTQKLHVMGNTIMNGKLTVGSNPGNMNATTAPLNVNGAALFKGGNPNLLDSLPRAGVEFFFGRGAVSNEIPGNYPNADIAFNYGEAQGGLRHFIATRHLTQVNTSGNAFDFYLNNSTNPFGSQKPGIGNKLGLSVSAKGTNIPDGYLGVGTSAEVGERLYVNGETKMEGNLNVLGATNLTGNLAVTGTTTLGYNTIFQDFSTAGSAIQVFTLTCPNGQRLLNGGGGHRDYSIGAQSITINYNGPDVTFPNTTWRIIVTNSDAAPKTIRLYCNCARIN